MAVIRSLELILNQHPAIGSDLLAQDVGSERADGPFLSLQLQINAKCLAQHGEVFRPCEPRSKLRRFACPDVAQLDTFEAAQIRWDHRAAFSSLDAGISASARSASRRRRR